MISKTANTATCVEIITIGNEMLIGQVVDTNSAWMARALNKAGFQVVQITTVGDAQKAILESIDHAFKRAEIVLITGGIGPTKDDITKQTLCLYFNTHLIHNEEVEANIRALFSTRPQVLNELTMAQAKVPETATIIQNKRGTAPITWFENKGRILVSMPGVPAEMEEAMRSDIIPRLSDHFKTPSLIHQTVLVVGIPESSLAIQLTDWENALPDFIKLAYLPSAGMVRLRLSGFLPDQQALDIAIENELQKLRSILGKAIFAETDVLPEVEIGRLLTEKGLWLATAESCTGGNIAHQLTTISGSSQFFKGSIVAYNNEVKIQQLGVKEDTLSQNGAVSLEVVQEMAAGVRKRLQSDIGVAVSGIAGPSGETEGKPVGTVWIAVCNDKKSITKRFQFGQQRIRNIEMATLMAFTLIKEILED